MLGIATLTMLTSSSAMNPATRQMASAFQRIGSGASVTCGSGLVGVVTASSSVCLFLPGHCGHEVAERERDVGDVESPRRSERRVERGGERGDGAAGHGRHLQ